MARMLAAESAVNLWPEYLHLMEDRVANPARRQSDEHAQERADARGELRVTQRYCKDNHNRAVFWQADLQPNIPYAWHRKRCVLRKGRSICRGTSPHDRLSGAHIHHFHVRAYLYMRIPHGLATASIRYLGCNRMRSIHVPWDNCQRY